MEHKEVQDLFVPFNEGEMKATIAKFKRSEESNVPAVQAESV